MNHEEIKKTLDSPAGCALKEYLLDEAHKLDSISNIPLDFDDSTIATKVSSRQEAFKIIKNILGKVLTWEDKPQGRLPEDNDNIEVE